MVFLCDCVLYCFFFFKQKTAYVMRISDWSSDVCSSDLAEAPADRISQVRAIEGIEMEAVDALGAQPLALFDGDRAGDELACAGVGVEAVEQLGHPAGHAGAAAGAELAELGEVGDRQSDV